MSLSLLLLAYALGLVAPGWLVARLLGAKQPWAMAGPLSMLVLLFGVELFDAAGIPLRAGPMFAWELAVCAALAVALRKWPPRAGPPAVEASGAAIPPAADERWQNRLLLGGIALLGLLAIARGFMAPLTGFDTLFRWDFLARQVLKEHSLAFYPPLSAADFHVYFHPDGFAPLVAMSHWWIYAVSGQTAPEAVMPLAMAQYVGALALAYQLAAHLAGSRRAGVLAAAVLAGTPLFFRSVMIGQETGLTAVGVAGMALALYTAAGAKDTRALVLAGLLGGGVAGLAREYGPAFVAVGMLVLLWRRLGWRAALVFGGVAALSLLPWHLRNWLRGGNPLYGHAPGLFPVNPVAEALMRKYQALFGLQTYDAAKWRALGGHLLLEAGVVVLAGLPAAVWLTRRAGWLLAGAAGAGALWLASVGYTSGGPDYAARVLSPALVLLAVAAAAGLERVSRGPVRRWAVTGLVLAAALYGAACAEAFPGVPSLAGGWEQAWAMAKNRWPSGGAEQVLLSPDLPKALPPGTRILTENAYAHAVVANAGAGYDLVPVWSPEVAFLFDKSLGATEQRRRLRVLNITALLLYQNSPNTRFLMESSPFYTDGVREPEPGKLAVAWPILWQGPVFAICLIPAAD